MDGILVLVIVLGVAVLAALIYLNLLIAKKFEFIANQKGHSGYLYWVFFLGVIGMLMVVALPDLFGRSSGSSSSTTEKTEETFDQLPDL